jgi:hypothetical protein
MFATVLRCRRAACDDDAFTALTQSARAIDPYWVETGRSTGPVLEQRRGTADAYHMTITIGRKFLAVLLVLLLLAGTAAGAYALGQSKADADGARREGYRQGRAAGVRQGEQLGFAEARKEDQQNARAKQLEDQIEYLGYSDWKDDRWYIVHIIKRTALSGGGKIASVNERQPMSTGLSYDLCGDEGESICWG